MKLEIPGATVKRKRNMQRLEREKHRPLLIVDEPIEPGIYSLLSDVGRMHKDKAVRYKVGRKTNVESQIRWAILLQRNKQGKEVMWGDTFYKTQENMTKQLTKLQNKFPNHGWRWAMVNLSFPKVEELS